MLLAVFLGGLLARLSKAVSTSTICVTVIGGAVLGDLSLSMTISVLANVCRDIPVIIIVTTAVGRDDKSNFISYISR